MEHKETKIKVSQFEMTGYTEYYQHYIEHCCDYWTLSLSLDTDLS